MKDAGLTIEELARCVEVDPKSVERWLRQGIRPHLRTQVKVAEELDREPAFFWPDDQVADDDDDLGPPAARDELLQLWAHRVMVPKEAWWRFLSSAQVRMDLLAYAMQFLPEDHVGFCDLLLAKARRACSIRIALADPDSAVVVQRDAEEQIGGGLAPRIRTTLIHLRPLFDQKGIELRFHATPMYNSIFRADNEMFVTPHLFGTQGYRSPLLYLRRQYDDGVFDNYAAHFDRIWATTVPITTL